MGLSDEKRQTPSQRVAYTGIVVDTFLHTLCIPQDKKQRLATALIEDFLLIRFSMSHKVASLRGRLRH